MSSETSVRIPPQLAESLYQNYDPIKIQLHESSPSTFQRRNSVLKEDTIAQNRLLNNENNVETVEAVQLESKDKQVEELLEASESSEPSKPSSLLKESSKQPLVNTVPGYNILRLLTGG